MKNMKKKSAIAMFTRNDDWRTFEQQFEAQLEILIKKGKAKKLK
jgi:hypothetical protein